MLSYFLFIHVQLNQAYKLPSEKRDAELKSHIIYNYLESIISNENWPHIRGWLSKYDRRLENYLRTNKRKLKNGDHYRFCENLNYWLDLIVQKGINKQLLEKYSSLKCTRNLDSYTDKNTLFKKQLYDLCEDINHLRVNEEKISKHINCRSIISGVEDRMDNLKMSIVGEKGSIFTSDGECNISHLDENISKVSCYIPGSYSEHFTYDKTGPLMMSQVPGGLDIIRGRLDPFPVLPTPTGLVPNTFGSGVLEESEDEDFGGQKYNDDERPRMYEQSQDEFGMPKQNGDLDTEHTAEPHKGEEHTELRSGEEDEAATTGGETSPPSKQYTTYAASSIVGISLFGFLIRKVISSRSRRNSRTGNQNGKNMFPLDGETGENSLMGNFEYLQTGIPNDEYNLGYSSAAK
ncbi:unnamed protein product [Plasmodium vivax]|uniref:(malaria parasite P. vivax) hypothetical protein n=1 Tax=Plasmodium vivax TaxID=5855 RepID=A0A565A492_PLAVI|nr:unnamed protein product [Plasmodium vivax]CAI7717626.1 PIR protein [Plasmodium vivax]VUZ99625.1 PIR protein [Plasmodium vivax]